MASFSAIIGVVGSGGIDIAPYMRVTPGEGLDPANSGYIEPAFAEAPLRDGGPLINIDAKNREMIFPVAFSSTTKDGLHALIQQVNIAFQTQSTFTWQDQGASNPTILDMQTGRVDVEYNFRRAQKFWCHATVHVWANPYGSTGTQRVVGTFTSSGALQSFVPASPILGDTAAKAVWQVTVGSYLDQPQQQLGRYIGVAVVGPSYVPMWTAGSIIGPTGNIVGASGAQGSQVIQTLITATLDDQIAGRVKLSAPVYAGRNRVMVVGRSMGEPAAALWLRDWEGNRVGASVIASGAKDMHLYDLGVVNVPSAGVPSLIQLDIMCNSYVRTTTKAYNAGFSIFGSASTLFQLNELIVMPEGNSALLTDDVDMPSLIAYDSFYIDPTNPTQVLMGHVTDTGHTWATTLQLAGAGQVADASIWSLYPQSDGVFAGGGPLISTATNVWTGYRLPSIGLSDMQISTEFALGNRNAGSTQGMRLKKEVGTETSYAVGLNVGTAPCMFIERYESSTPTAGLASIAVLMPTTNGYRYRFVTKFAGATISAAILWDDPAATQPVIATMAAGGGVLQNCYKNGDPGFVARADPSTGVGWPLALYDFRVESVPTQRIGPRDVYVLDGVAGEVYRKPAGGDVQRRLTHKLRGQIPKVPMSPSAGRFVAFALGIPEGVAGDVTDLSVSVREQFRFAR